MKSKLQIFLLSLIFSINLCSAKDYNSQMLFERAIYMFEAEGKYQEATKLLIAIRDSANEYFSTQAAQSLGLIHELNQNSKQAVKNYEKILISPDQNFQKKINVEKHISGISSQVAYKIKSIYNLKKSIQNTLSKEKLFFLLSDNNIYKYNNNKFNQLIQQMPEDDYFLMYQNATIHSLNPLRNTISSTMIGKQSPTKQDIYPHQVRDILKLNNSQYLVFTTDSIYKRSYSHINWTKPNQFAKCKAISQLVQTQEAILQCPENTIYVMDLNTGNTKTNISILENINFTFTHDNSIILVTENNIYFFSPNKNISHIWKREIKSIKAAINTSEQLLIQQTNGNIIALNIKNGETLWQRKTSYGQLYDLDHFFGLYLSNGTFQYFSPDGKLLWQYQSGKKLSHSPIIISDQLFLSFTDGTIISLNPFYYGQRKSEIDQMLDQAYIAWKNGLFDQAQTISNEIIKNEPNSSEAWEIQAKCLSNLDSKEDTLVNNKITHALFKSIIGKSSLDSSNNSLIKQYSEHLNADWIQKINIPTLYFPTISSLQKNNLALIDNERQLVEIRDINTGNIINTIPTGKIDKQSSEDIFWPYLIVSDKLKLKIFNLSENKPISINYELPSNLYSADFNNNILYITTWDGHIIKYDLINQTPIWQIKPFTKPPKISFIDNYIFAISTNKIIKIDSKSSNFITSRKIYNSQNIDIKTQDSLIYTIENNNRIICLNSKMAKKWENHFASQIFTITVNKNSLLIGLADQRIVKLNLISGIEEWSYQGNNSIFMKPYIYKQHVFIEQGKNTIGINLKSGKKEITIELPEIVGSPIVVNNKLIIRSQNGLLYAFYVN